MTITPQEQAYFEGFSSHNVTDDCWWDTWTVCTDSFSYGTFRTEEEAQEHLIKMQTQSPDNKFEIVHIENAGFGDYQYKSLYLRIFPYWDWVKG